MTPALDDAFARHEQPVIVDAGAGNAYLGFILHELFVGPKGRGEVLGIEARCELVEQAKSRAVELGYDRLRVLESAVETAPVPDRVHVLVALHACDTATDDALLLALAKGADHVAVVPCCQAEVARQLREAGRRVPDPELAPLWQHAWHAREFGSHLTNVIRALVLEAHGYQVTVTELAGWEHSLKNELILGRRVHQENPKARRALMALLARVPARPKLVRELGLLPEASDLEAPPAPAAEDHG